MFFTYNNWLLMSTNKGFCRREGRIYFGHLAIVQKSWILWDIFLLLRTLSILIGSCSIPMAAQSCQFCQLCEILLFQRPLQTATALYCDPSGQLHIFPVSDHFSFLLLSFPFGLSKVQLCTTCFFQLGTANSRLLLFKSAILSCSYAQAY